MSYHADNALTIPYRTYDPFTIPYRADDNFFTPFQLSFYRNITSYRVNLGWYLGGIYIYIYTRSFKTIPSAIDSDGTILL